MTFAGESNRHLAECFYAIRIPSVVSRADLATADAIVNYLLLVAQVPKIRADNRSKLFIRRTAPVLSRVNTREREETDNQKSR